MKRVVLVLCAVVLIAGIVAPAASASSVGLKTTGSKSKAVQIGDGLTVLTVAVLKRERGASPFAVTSLENEAGKQVLMSTTVGPVVGAYLPPGTYTLTIIAFQCRAKAFAHSVFVQ